MITMSKDTSRKKRFKIDGKKVYLPFYSKVKNKKEAKELVDKLKEGGLRARMTQEIIYTEEQLEATGNWEIWSDKTKLL